MHAEELTKAREGYLPTSEVDAKIAEMNKRYDETYKSWESSKAEAAELKTQYDDLKRKADQEKEMRESTIKDVQTRYDDLEKLVLEHSHKILGKLFNFVAPIDNFIESPCVT